MQKKHRFDLFRLSLRQREQVDMEDLIRPERSNREAWIRHLFSQRVEFRHHGTDFVYLPSEAQAGQKYVIGRIGREVSELENASPELGYREIMHDAWKAAVIVVDPGEHTDGQKVAIQFHPSVVKPSTIAPRLLQALDRENSPSPYIPSIHPITNKEAFWEFAARNKGKITKITFDLEVPNMFGTDDEYTKEMREFREIEKAKSIKLEISNPDGIDVDTDRVRYTVEKASLGTGSVTAKALGKNNKFSSNEQQISASISVESDGEVKSIFDQAVDFANRMLGRD